MKINLISSAFAALMGFALTTAPLTSHAQTTNAAPAPAATTPADTSTAPKVKEKKSTDYTPYSGTISAIDASSVTVTTKKGDMKFMLDATTMVQVDHKKADVSTFAVGDKVTGSYKTGSDGTMMAHSLRKKSTK